MRTKATVKEISGSLAIVESERLSACEGCHKHEEGCSVCSLMGSNRKITARAFNRVGAEVGDVVEIETETKKVLFYAMLVFLLPVVLMIGIYFFASWLGGSQPVCILSAFGGFAAVFLALWLYSGRRISRRYDTEIVSVLKKKE